MNHFCTISTASHLYKVKALAESLRNQKREFVLHVLVVDGGNFSFPNCKYWNISNLPTEETTQTITEKFKHNVNKLRWSLKPVFLKQLLLIEKAEKIIYLDNDLFFYSDFQFLFDYLNTYSFLLTPHYYKHDPKSEQNWLEANFRVGLFNAGFIGVNKNALNTLQWWADCCAYRCEKNSFRGLFDDQRYLDLIPVIEPDAYIVRHKGCNIAGWNIDLCKREMIDSQIRIDGKFPVVFIHFNNYTVWEIMKGRDKILSDFFYQYVDVLEKYKQNFVADNLLFDIPLLDKLKLKIWKILTNLGI